MKLASLLAATIFLLTASHASADTWPSKPIRFIVAAPGGSSLDVIARTLGDKLKEHLGQAIVVENIPGAAGTIATGNVAKAAPDGRTMPLSFNGPLAVTSAARFSLLPELPTVAEAGLPKFEALAWNGVLVPAGTPADIVKRLNHEIDAALKMPDVKTRLNNAGLETADGSPEVFKSLIAAEAKKWSELIKQTGATSD